MVLVAQCFIGLFALNAEERTCAIRSNVSRAVAFSRCRENNAITPTTRESTVRG